MEKQLLARKRILLVILTLAVALVGAWLFAGKAFEKKMNMRVDNAFNGSSDIYIVTEPEDYEGIEGSTAVFEVEATGEELSYQWQISKDNGETWTNSSVKKSKYSTVLKESTNGRMVRCIVTDANQDSVETRAAVMKVKDLAITTNPTDFVGDEGNTATFTVGAESSWNSVTLSYQWQYSSDNGLTWNNSSVKKQTYTTSIKRGMDGRKIRCIVSDGKSEAVASEAASITVNGVFGIKTDIQSVKKGIGDEAQFTVEATGKGLSYKWQTSLDGETWTDSEETSKQLTIADLVMEQDGMKVKVIVTDMYERKVESEIATVDVVEDLAIEANPENFVGKAQDVALFAVEATGEGLKYQWQYSVDNGETWNNSSVKKKTYSTTVKKSMDGRLVRCVVTDVIGRSVPTEAAFIHIVEEIAITEDLQDCQLGTGETAEFTVEATGEGLTYSWKMSTDGETWENLLETTNVLEIPELTIEQDGLKVYCIITDLLGRTKESAVATIDVVEDLVIVKDVHDIYGAIGETVSFKVEATGEELTYLWKISNDGLVWYDSEETSNELVIEDIINTPQVLRVYCIVTDVLGRHIGSTIGYLHVVQDTEIISNPSDCIKGIGDAAEFEVAAIGEGLTYLWQISFDGETWDDTSADTANFVIEDLTLDEKDLQVRCIVTDILEREFISDIATIDVVNNLTITTDIEDVLKAIGDTVEFEIVAEGEELTYLWQTSMDGENWIDSENTTAQFSVENLSLALDGLKVRCIITDRIERTVTSEVATIDVVDDFVLTSDLEDVAKAIGASASFVAVAQGEGLTYKWQTSFDGENWENSNQTTAVFTIENLTLEQDGIMVKCTITDVIGRTIVSKTATIDVVDDLSIIEDLGTVWVGQGDTAQFKLKANGEGLTYTWFCSYDMGHTWIQNDSNTNIGYVENVTYAHNNALLKCIITDKLGRSVESCAGPLIVVNDLSITDNIQNYIGEVGDTATFTIGATGQSLSYQWKYSVDEGATWKNIVSVGSSYSVRLTAGMDGRLIKCIVKDLIGRTVESNVVSIHIAADLTIVTQPVDCSRIIGDTAQFSVEASGEELEYKWLYSRDGERWIETDATTQVLTVDELSIQQNGLKMKCIIEDVLGRKVTSEIATLYVVEDLTIVENPNNCKVGVGSTGKFVVVAKGAEVSYQWQISADGENWEDIDGATSDVYEIENVERNIAGYKFRCVVTDSFDRVETSEAATIIIAQDLAIVTDISSCVKAIGSDLILFVEATGEDIEFNWQISTDEEKWTDTGVTSSLFAIENLGMDKDDLFVRCVVTDVVGRTVTSNVAKIDVAGDSHITLNPSDVSKAIGANATFTVEAEGVGHEFTYQWFYLLNNAENWVDAQVTTNTYTVEDITAAQDDMLVKCCVTDSFGEVMTSTVARLDVFEDIVFVKDLENFVGYVGETATFDLVLEGKDISYQWKYSNDGGLTWKNIMNVGSLYSVKATSAMDGRMIKCEVWDSFGRYRVSHVATMNVIEKFSIVSQPQNCICELGGTAEFSVNATGEELLYQWQVSNDGQNWENVQATTNEFSIADLTWDNDGLYVRCVLEDVLQNQKITKAAVINIEGIHITSQPSDCYVEVGDDAEFEVVAEGDGLEYLWQISTDNGETWADAGSTSSTLTIEGVLGTANVRCIITDSESREIVSSVATVYIYS